MVYVSLGDTRLMGGLQSDKVGTNILKGTGVDLRHVTCDGFSSAVAFWWGQSAIDSAQNDHAAIVQSILENKEWLTRQFLIRHVKLGNFKDVVFTGPWTLGSLNQEAHLNKIKMLFSKFNGGTDNEEEIHGYGMLSDQIIIN